MSMISGTRTLLTATTVLNAIAGDTFEFLRADSTIKFGVVSNVFGGDFTFQIGDAFSVQAAPIGVEVALNQVSADRDMKYVDAGRAGERLTLTLNNPTAGTLIMTWLILIA